MYVCMCVYIYTYIELYVDESFKAPLTGIFSASTLQKNPKPDKP